MFDIRQNKLVARSDNMETEVLSLTTVRVSDRNICTVEKCLTLRQGHRKVVCGMGDGVLGLFSWGDWGDVNDRFPGHPLPIDCLQKIDEEMICTAASDGLIRYVPAYAVGVVSLTDLYRH